MDAKIIPWGHQRANLINLYNNFGKAVNIENFIDAAYLAGLEDGNAQNNEHQGQEGNNNKPSGKTKI